MKAQLKNKAKILVADLPNAVTRLRKALPKSAYEFHVAHTQYDAIAAIKEKNFNLVIAGMHFDESRMLNLLATVKIEMQSPVPFMCFRHLHSPLSEDVYKGVQLSAEQLGACKFIDDAYNLSDEEIRHAVDECIESASHKSKLKAGS